MNQRMVVSFIVYWLLVYGLSATNAGPSLPFGYETFDDNDCQTTTGTVSAFDNNCKTLPSLSDLVTGSTLLRSDITSFSIQCSVNDIITWNTPLNCGGSNNQDTLDPSTACFRSTNGTRSFKPFCSLPTPVPSAATTLSPSTTSPSVTESPTTSGAESTQVSVILASIFLAAVLSI